VSFQLMAGTNKDLRQAVANGEFRADLFARLNTWTFFLPSLKDRLEDLPANIDYELARLGSEQQQQYRFTSEARQLYESFAMSKNATWQGNFRDLTASMIRLTTLAESKVIRNDDVQAEIERLTHLWELPDSLNGSNRLGSDSKGNTTLDSETIEQGSHNILRKYLDEDMLITIDPFDAVQLAYVIEICINHKNQAAAGRYLYANSRDKLKSPNDSDRLRKYLLKFGLRFDGLK
ncbi:MAG: sigma 54-interacting transcriptional regulator, partial [Psychrobacter sp.]